MSTDQPMEMRANRGDVPQTSAGRELYRMFTTGPDRLNAGTQASLAHFIAAIEAEAVEGVVKRAVERLLLHPFLQGSVNELLPWLVAPADDHRLLPGIDQIRRQDHE